MLIIVVTDQERELGGGFQGGVERPGDEVEGAGRGGEAAVRRQVPAGEGGLLADRRAGEARERGDEALGGGADAEDGNGAPRPVSPIQTGLDLPLKILTSSFLSSSYEFKFLCI